MAFSFRVNAHILKTYNISKWNQPLRSQYENKPLGIIFYSESISTWICYNICAETKAHYYFSNTANYALTCLNIQVKFIALSGERSELEFLNLHTKCMYSNYILQYQLDMSVCKLFYKEKWPPCTKYSQAKCERLFY